MNIFYRGYVIHREPWTVGYTVFGRRPLRAELAMCLSSIEAMQWIDHRLANNPLIPSIRAATSDQLTLI
jgi:hypothetical protein